MADRPPSPSDYLARKRGDKKPAKTSTKRPPTPSEYRASIGAKARRFGIDPDNPSKPRSLLGQVADIAGSIPRGLVGLGRGVATEIAHARGPARQLLSTGTSDYQPPKREPGESLPAYAARTGHPIVGGLVASTQEAVGDIREPRRFKKASDEGTIVSKVVNDLGVIAPFLKGAGIAADAAGAGATSERLVRASELAARGADAPFVPFRAAAKGAGVAGRAGFERVATSEGRAGELLRTLKVDPASRQLRADVLTPSSERLSEGIGRQVDLGKRIERIVPDVDEQRAMTLVAEKEAPALALARRNLPGDEFDALLERRYGPTVTRRAVDLAADVHEGRNPELAARIDEALKVGREAPGGRAERSAAYVADKPATREAQLGFEPLPEVVDAAVEREMRALPKARRDAATARTRADAASARVDEARSAASVVIEDRRAAGQSTRPTYGMGRELGKLEQRARVLDNVATSAERRVAKLERRVGAAGKSAAASVEAAPARLRPELTANQAVRAALREQETSLRSQGLADAADRVARDAAELPSTLAELRARGVDVDHWIHPREGTARSRAGVREQRLPQTRRARSEQQRSGSAAYDRTVRGQTQAEIDEIKTTVARHAAEQIAAMPRISARLGRGPLEGITTKEAAYKAGWRAWDPRSPFESPASVTADTVFLPEHLFAGFRSYFTDPQWDHVARLVYDPAVQAWKTAVLPLSPSWNVGNLAGNLLLATVAGGVNPLELARQIRKVVADWRASGPRGERTFDVPRRLLTAGPTHEELRFLREPNEELLAGTRVGRAARAAAKPVTATAHAGYALNEFIDNVGRSAVYLAKRAKGASEEQALRESLKALGDFSRMTPFERRVVRRIIPFYAWQRHLTQLAFRLPLEHPLRVSWTLALADEFGRPDSELPDYLRGGIPVGDELLSTGGLNPFARVGGLLLNPGDFARSLSPVLRLAAENVPGSPARGRNLQSGRDYTRPPGTGRHDEYGRPLATAPSLTHQLAGMVPQTRIVDAVTGRDRVVRYDTGDPVYSGGRPIVSDRGGLANAGLRALGLSFTPRQVAAEIAKRAAENRRREQRARERYARRRAG